MRQELAKEDAWVDAIYYCPHHPNDNCDCRKPKTKLLLQAAKDFDIDLKQSFVVGDLQMDINLGKTVGCKTILIKGDTSPEKEDEAIDPDAVASDLLEAARRILRWEGEAV